MNTVFKCTTYSTLLFKRPSCLGGGGLLLLVGALGHQDLLDGGVDGLLQLLGLLLVVQDKGVQELGAADLELGGILVLLDLDVAGVLAGGDVQELLEVLDLLGHIDFFLFLKLHFRGRGDETQRRRKYVETGAS